VSLLIMLGVVKSLTQMILSGVSGFIIIIIYIKLLLNFYCSEKSPEMDESNVGNRDPALKSTYKGLVNIRYVFLF
jgi:hypothetical protein